MKKNLTVEATFDLAVKSYQEKKFNIAGKMNLNEWRGKKSIEFIIEDISLH